MAALPAPTATPMPLPRRGGWRRTSGLLLGLGIATFLLDWFAPVLLYNHSLVLGVVAYWMAIWILRPGAAALLLLGSTLTLGLKWDQPYSALILALQGVLVAGAWKRGSNPIAAAAIFWLALGTPLSWLVYRHVLPLPQPALGIALSLQFCNGCLAAWLALLLVRQLPPDLRPSTADSRGSLRSVLLKHYAAFGTIPVLAAGLIAARTFEEHTLREAEDGLRAQANLTATLVARTVAEAHATVRELAAGQGPTTAAWDPSALSRQLDQSVRANAIFVTMLAADAKGNVVAAAPATIKATGNVADRDYFRQPMRTGASYVSGIFRGRGFGSELIVAISAPVRSPEGKAVGIIEGSILVEKLASPLRRNQPGAQWRQLLADERQRVIASVYTPEQPLQPLAGTRWSRAIAREGRPPFRLSDEVAGHRVTHLSHTVRIPDLGWTLTMEREWQDVVQPVLVAYAWILGVVFLTTIVAAIAATWSLGDLLAGWRALMQFASHPLERRPELTAARQLDVPREFRILISNLDQMAENLAREKTAREALLAELEARVKERTRELSVALSRAEAADRTKGAFLASVSHELRTPLTAITTGHRVLARTLPAADPTTRLTLSHIERATVTLTDLIDNILEFSRLEAGTGVVSSSSFSPGQLLDDVVQHLNPQALRHGTPLRCLGAGCDATWESDPTKVRAILVHLAANAIQFGAPGEVHLRWWIQTGGHPQADQLWFSVQDHGPGIPPESLEEIFAPFVQLPGNPVRSQAGTGIGLSIVRRLVNLLGGRIEVQSQPGQGAEFRFWISRLTPEPTASAS